MSVFNPRPFDCDCGDLEGLSDRDCFLDGVEFGMFVQTDSFAVISGKSGRMRMRSCHHDRLVHYFESNQRDVDIKWINDDLITVRTGDA